MFTSKRYHKSPMFTSNKGKKTEPLSVEMQLKLLRLGVGLKLSNSKLGIREAALYLFVKQIPPIDSWNQVNSDRFDFNLLTPALTPWIVLVRHCHSAWRHRKSTICVSIVYVWFRGRHLVAVKDVWKMLTQVFLCFLFPQDVVWMCKCHTLMGQAVQMNESYTYLFRVVRAWVKNGRRTSDSARVTEHSLSWNNRDEIFISKRWTARRG